MVRNASPADAPSPDEENRPAGVCLKGDLTACTAERRTLKVPNGGAPAAIADVEASLRLRLAAAFPRMGSPSSTGRR